MTRLPSLGIFEGFTLLRFQAYTAVLNTIDTINMLVPASSKLLFVALGILSCLVRASIPIIGECWSCRAWRGLKLISSAAPVLLSIILASTTSVLEAFHLLNGRQYPLTSIVILWICELSVHNLSLIQHAASLWGIFSVPPLSLAVGLLIILVCGIKASLDTAHSTPTHSATNVWISICAGVSLGSTLYIIVAVSLHSHFIDMRATSRRSDNTTKPLTVRLNLLASYLMHVTCMVVVLVPHHDLAFAALKLTGVSVPMGILIPIVTSGRFSDTFGHV
ncbi:hypothetical protein NM688_g2716 [Phlebia brevispora]|uniref:Uncharacterized protein n=1 Tax=Phlebia brevispora TaxID=194682 RepID=A0ACC1T7Y0_9APHY|nr:hypothetical protein NM688_g2716 [Phlebia brevispora]